MRFRLSEGGNDFERMSYGFRYSSSTSEERSNMVFLAFVVAGISFVIVLVDIVLNIGEAEQGYIRLIVSIARVLFWLSLLYVLIDSVKHNRKI